MGKESSRLKEQPLALTWEYAAVLYKWLGGHESWSRRESSTRWRQRGKGPDLWGLAEWDGEPVEGVEQTNHVIGSF